MEKNIYASTFETNIRVVGGLLAAYDLDKDTMLLDKAKEMADRLYPAFNTPSGYPYVYDRIMNMMVLGLRQFGDWPWSFPFLEWWKCYFGRIRYHVFRIQVFLLLNKLIDVDIYLIIPRIPNMPKSSIRSILRLVVNLLGTVCSPSLYCVQQYHHASR